MAIIECPNCSAQISSRATKCPKCGADLESEPASDDERAALVCEECGKVLEPGMETCPECGCPVHTDASEEEKAAESESTAADSTQPKKTSGKKKQAIIAIVAVVVAIIVIACIKAGMDASAQKQAEEQAAQYEANLSSAASEMLDGAAAAEKAGGMIHDVWYNTINKESDVDTDEYTKSGRSFHSDFNESITSYMSSSSYKSLKSTITSSQEKVTGYMKDLTNPPSEYAEAYNAISDLYDAYNDMVQVALDPSGSLVSYTSTLNDADSAFLSKYKKMELYL